MKLGTKSLLFGVHQVLWHPFTVWRAWRHLYGRPTWRECVCIMIHDWGYFGCPEMDGPEGELHPLEGAAIAGFLFGPKYYDLVLLHSRHLANKMGLPPSKLCWADKLSMRFEPQWFYLLRARVTGEILEYRRKADASGFIPYLAPDKAWHGKLVKHLEVLSCEKAIEHSEARA
jgi:hypothetical protein